MHSTANDPLSSRISTGRSLAPVFVYFLIAGVVTVMLGPLLPALMGRWHIEDAQAGTLFTATFAGQLCGAWFAVHHLRISIIGGSVVTAIGCAALALASFNAAHIALFCVGLGIGGGLTAGNVIAGTSVTSGRARLLAILNVSWSLGAIACPMLVRACGSNINGFFYLASAALLLVAVIATAIPQAPPREQSETEHPKSRLPLPLTTLVMFSIAMLLFVGIENDLGGWLPSYAIRVNPLAHAPTIAFYFWTAELMGRLLMATPVNFLREATLYRVSTGLLGAALAVLIAIPHLSPNHVVALTILSGLAIAPLYPLILAFLLARTGSDPRLGPLFASASLGGATLPWLTGVVSTHFHDLRAGLAVPAAAAILMLLLAAPIAPSTPRPKQAEA